MKVTTVGDTFQTMYFNELLPSTAVNSIHPFIENAGHFHLRKHFQSNEVNSDIICDFYFIRLHCVQCRVQEKLSDLGARYKKLLPPFLTLFW